MSPAAAVLHLVDHASELVHRRRGILDHLRLVDLVGRLAERVGEGRDVLGRLGAGGDHPSEVGRIARDQHLARRHRRRARVADGDLHDPVAEQALSLDARDRVLADPVGEAPADGEVDPDLAARLRRKVHAAHPADLHAGQTDRRALDQAADFGELGVDRVARLEQPCPCPEGVDGAQEGRERDQDEDADAKLCRNLTLLVHGILFTGSPRPRVALRHCFPPGKPGPPDCGR